MKIQTVEKPSVLLLSTLVLGGIAFGIQSMARTTVPPAWSISERTVETSSVSVQQQDLDVLMFLHQNAGS